MIAIDPARRTLPGLSTASVTEESGAHDANRFGFALGADDHRAAGVPPERKPLTRRDIRSWTIASVMSGLLLATVAAVLSSRDAPREITETAAAPAPTPVARQPEQPPALAPVPPPELAPAGVPLHALPLVKESSRSTTAAAAASSSARRTVRAPRVVLADSARRATTTTTKKPAASRSLSLQRKTSANATAKPSPRSTTSTKKKGSTTE